MCFDAGREGSSLWFSLVEESRAELPHTRHRVGGRSCNTPKYTLVVFDMFRVFCKLNLNVS